MVGKEKISGRGSAGGRSNRKEVTFTLYTFTHGLNVEDGGGGGRMGNLCVYAAGSHISCVQVAPAWCLMRGGVCVGVRGEACLLKPALDG